MARTGIFAGVTARLSELWSPPVAEIHRNPMEEVLSTLDSSRLYALSDVVDIAMREHGLTAQQATDLTGITSNVPLHIRPEDVGYVQDLLCESGEMVGSSRVEQPILAAGSNLAMRFDPYEMSAYVNSTMDAVSGATSLNHAQFVSSATGREAVPSLVGVEMNGFSIQPAEDGTLGNVALTLDRCSARDGSFQGNNNRLTANASDLSGLNAEDCRNLALDITSSTIGAGADGQPANFNGVSLAPDSRIAGCEVSATFHHAALGNVDLRNSLLRTEGMFAGASFSADAQFAGVIATPEVFIGASVGGREINADNVGAFMAERGITDARAAGYAQPVQPEVAPSQPVAQVAINTDVACGLEEAICASYGAAAALRAAGVAPEERVAGKAIDLAEQNATHHLRVDHSAEYALGTTNA